MLLDEHYLFNSLSYVKHANLLSKLATIYLSEGKHIVHKVAK